jgi:hypothetical protein
MLGGSQASGSPAHLAEARPVLPAIRDVTRGKAVMAMPDSMRNVYAEFYAGTFENLVRKLGRGEHVGGAELALALRSNPDLPVPPVVRDYLCRYLEGKVRKPGGRKPGGAVKLVRDVWAAGLYQQYLAWLKRRKRRFGLTGWLELRCADWWQGPPHERAARMVARRMFRNQNLEACAEHRVFTKVAANLF